MITAAIITFGYLGIALAVFAESGFLIGFFLPGDSLLFTIGLLASKGLFNIWFLWPLCIVMAILGDSFGYWMGKRFGPSIFSRQDSLLFKKVYVDKTREFYDRHGKKTIILSRFVPVVRTFAPIFAGVGEMDYTTFLSYNVIGGILWCSSLMLPAYFLGKTFPQIQEYLSFIIIGIVILSVVPIVWNIIASRKKSKPVV